MSFLEKKSLISLMTGLFLLFFVSLINLSQGQAGFTIVELITDVWQPGRIQDIILEMRLPRLVIGILAGGALAASGVLFQTLTNNPLASASTLGINSGAFFAVVFAAVFFPSWLAQFSFLVAFAGAVLTTIFVLILAGKELNPVRVALTGMIITLLFSSLTAALQLLFENETGGLFLWGSGTLIQMDWSGTIFAAPFIVIAIILALLLGKSLDVLALGEDMARSLGQSTDRLKFFAWTIGITLAAVVVSVVGVIGFIGLIAPHIVRLIGITGHRQLIIHSFLWGSVILITADSIARWIQPGQEIPVGAMTALVGGPWLMFLAYKTAKQQKRGEKTLGGTKKPVSKKLVYPILAVISIIMIYVSFSYGGVAWASVDEWFSPIIAEFRIPRVLIAFIVGVMLAISGMMLQGVLRNPLADSSILGITSLGGAGAMMFLILFPSLPAAWMPVGAIIGAFLALVVILISAWRNGLQPILVALMGISLSAFGSAIIQILVVKADLVVAAALVWLSGSTYAKTWDEVQIVFILFIVLLPLAIYLTRSLDAIAFGDELATSHGLNVYRTRLVALITSVTFSAIAVSFVGTIGFIGLLAPHMARRIVGFNHLPLLITSSLLGGILLVAADFIGRTVLVPKEIPSGLVVALIGAPYLLYLLKKTK
ncbi:iron ABC transporter permease [Alkalibacillus aidingensis]|uniref:iron ABC transporter permease n=1 Tax=Alkalibacillus aidingensis TaxID=2747607 RepID=UPI0016602D30|nr:iron ABC transporter permease [Alkalibacillus aidingensis]